MLGLLRGEDDVLEFSVLSQYKSITSQQAYADELRYNMSCIVTCQNLIKVMKVMKNPHPLHIIIIKSYASSNLGKTTSHSKTT